MRKIIAFSNIRHTCTCKHPATQQIVQYYIHRCLFIFKQTISTGLSLSLSFSIYAISCMILFFPSFQLSFSLYTSFLCYINTKKIHRRKRARVFSGAVKIKNVNNSTKKYWVTLLLNEENSFYSSTRIIK